MRRRSRFRRGTGGRGRGGPFETDDFESLRVELGGVARDATEVSGRQFLMTAGAFLDLPVELVDKGRGRHGVIVAAHARRRVAEGLVVAPGAFAFDLDVHRVVEINAGKRLVSSPMATRSGAEISAAVAGRPSAHGK